MKPAPMDRYDFISGIVLTLFAAAVLIESLRMDRLEEVNVNPYTVPGLVPGLLGGLLLACGLALLLRSLLRGGWRLGLDGEAIRRFLASPAVRRVGLVLLLSYGFAIVLFGWLPFAIGAALFIFVFILLLGPRQFESRNARLREIALAAAVAVVAGFGIDLVFTQVFFVKLP